ncbi:MAG: histidine phosphatase family protein [Chloroflexota bacterium]|nr:histidine phosphatase family protein [Chloroflexota bacterium]
MSDNTSILLIRHADVHNPEQIVYGRLPRFRLSDDGVAQAEKTAEALANEPLSAIYTSPMLRARQTARIIARHHPGVPLRVARLLLEVQTSWQGTRWADIAPDTNLYEPLVNPGDETMDEVGDRMERFVRQLLRRHPGETVACVSHADPVMIAKVRLQGKALNMETIRGPEYPERASITRLTFNRDGSLVGVEYANPAQDLIKPYEYLKQEAPAEASTETETSEEAVPAS